MTRFSGRFRVLNHSLVYLVLSVGAFIMIFPLLWTISTSLKTVDQLVFTQIKLIPDPVAWVNYIEVFRRAELGLYLRNTMTVMACAELGSLIVCSLVAYGFARIPFPGRDIMFLLLLSSMMLPGVVQLIPQFVMFDRLGWLNTFLPLVVPRFLAHNPFYIFLLRQFFRGIPEDLCDAARMDGSSELGIWWRIVIPLSRPALATVGIFTFQYVWNDFLHPLVYPGNARRLWTLAIGLSALKGIQTGQEPTEHYQMAYSVLMIVPMMLVFAFGQQYFIRGITFSGLKG